MKYKVLLPFVVLLIFSTLAFKQSDEIDKRYTVYIFLLDDCRISEYYTPELNKLHAEYSNDSIEFIGLFPNFSSKPAQIDAFQETYSISFPLKTDYYKQKTKEFGVRVTPEVVIFDNIKQSVLYKGRIDNSYFKVGRRRTVINKFELRNALNAIQEGTEIEITETEAIGCFINFSDQLSK